MHLPHTQSKWHAISKAEFVLLHGQGLQSLARWGQEEVPAARPTFWTTRWHISCPLLRVGTAHVRHSLLRMVRRCET